MNKTVLVTGAGRGMAFEVAKAHAALGDKVLCLAHSLTSELKALAESSELVKVELCELTYSVSVNQALSSFSDKIDILYNIAGIYRFDQNCGIDSTSMEECIKMYDVNALGPMRVLQGMRKQLSPDAIVMNVSSEAGSIGMSGRAGEYGYCMSKAALNMASKIFSNELKKEGSSVRVFCFHPGWIRTQMGGEGAAKSPYSISAQEAAECVMKVTLNPSAIPADIMYLDYQGNFLQW